MSSKTSSEYLFFVGELVLPIARLVFERETIEKLKEEKYHKYYKYGEYSVV